MNKFKQIQTNSNKFKQIQTNSNKLIIYLFVATSVFFFSRCSKDDKLVTEEEFKVEKGMVVFKDPQAFIAFRKEYEKSSTDDREVLREKIPINTSAKLFESFKNFLNANDALSDEELTDQIYKKWESKISVTRSKDGLILDQKFNHFSEYANEEGYFKVGKSLYKVFDGGYFIITKPTNIDYSFLNKEYNVANDKSILKLIEKETNLRAACLRENKSAKESNGKRIQVESRIFNATVCEHNGSDPNGNGTNWIIDPAFVINVRSTTEKRKGFIIKWWGCEQTQFTHSWVLNVAPFFNRPGQPATSLSGLPSTINWTDSFINSGSTCTSEFEEFVAADQITLLTTNPLTEDFFLEATFISVSQTITAFGLTETFTCN